MQFSAISCMHIELDSENTPCMNKDRTLSLRSLVLGLSLVHKAYTVYKMENNEHSLTV